MKQPHPAWIAESQERMLRLGALYCQQRDMREKLADVERQIEAEHRALEHLHATSDLAADAAAPAPAEPPPS